MRTFRTDKAGRITVRPVQIEEGRNGRVKQRLSQPEIFVVTYRAAEWVAFYFDGFGLRFF